MDAIAQEIGRLLTGAFTVAVKLEQNLLKGTRFENLTVGELHTVEAIGEGERTMGEIAGDLGVTLATLNASVTRLCDKGYARRRRTEEDRRRVLVTLTRDGRIVRRLHKTFHDKMVDEILSDLSSNEKEALSSALMKIEGYFEKAANRPRKEGRA